MNIRVLFAAVLVIVLSFAPVGYCAQEANTDVPKIFMPVDMFEFSPVLEGTEVIRDLTVQNKGTADLEIKEVKTG